MQRFIDKVVLITGSAEGMGRAITLAFPRGGLRNGSIPHGQGKLRLRFQI